MGVKALLDSQTLVNEMKKLYILTTQFATSKNFTNNKGAFFCPPYSGHSAGFLKIVVFASESDNIHEADKEFHDLLGENPENSKKYVTSKGSKFGFLSVGEFVKNTPNGFVKIPLPEDY